MLPEYEIDSRFLALDEGTSDGTQIKYFYEGKWFKVDRYGGEGAVEELASEILRISGYPSSRYVSYKACIVNGDKACYSDNFLKDKETFISLYRLYYNVLGRDPLVETSKMDYDDAIECILSFVKRYTGLDISDYLADTFVLDELILNEDRHFNNLGLIFDGKGYRKAPIFDNGKSLFVGNKRYDPEKKMADNIKYAFAKCFSGSFELNRQYLDGRAGLNIDKKLVEEYLLSRQRNKDDPHSRLLRILKESE